MQVHNADVEINVVGRNVEVSEAMREHALKKVESLHLDYPKIIEARVVLDVQVHHNRHIAEVILFCANHITIEAHSETHDMYASIDETIGKIARRMRKRKTRLLKKHRPRKGEVSRLAEAVFAIDALDGLDEDPDDEEELEPVIVHKENYRIRPLFHDEAMVDMELSDRDFLVFKNAESGVLSILFRRKDGDYGLIEPEI
ncbi:MAG: ribosome-associated translation inhibitor RaiA [Verrucomicrobiaceae bacterium]|nr:ribosome-associated translation inhibitor RaiA [Verrucomicrobiaceae bacterium]